MKQERDNSEHEFSCCPSPAFADERRFPVAGNQCALGAQVHTGEIKRAGWLQEEIFDGAG